jgi:hypothetical protein
MSTSVETWVKRGLGIGAVLAAARLSPIAAAVGLVAALPFWLAARNLDRGHRRSRESRFFLQLGAAAVIIVLVLAFVHAASTVLNQPVATAEGNDPSVVDPAAGSRLIRVGREIVFGFLALGGTVVFLEGSRAARRRKRRSKHSDRIDFSDPGGIPER